MNRKTFLFGALTGAAVILILEGAILGGRALWLERESVSNNEVPIVESMDETDEASDGVFADSGNPIITDTEGKIKIEVVPPSGYKLSQDYESAYGAEFYNEAQTIRLLYGIENYTSDAMHSYYEFENKFFETSKDVSYTNVSTSEVKSMEVNGYQVNYISLSYTYDETENYTEYCAYVMLNDETEFMCSIYARSDDINEDIIKDCFASQIPVTQ